jgi:hypothetical protein
MEAKISSASTTCRVVERDFVRHPLVVDGGLVDAQHDVLDPVGRWPAGRAARTQPDAPRHAAILDDLVLQRQQVFHGLRHFVAGILEIVRRIPDERFHVGLVGEGEELFGSPSLSL